MVHFTPLTDEEFHRWLALDLIVPLVLTPIWVVCVRLIDRHKLQRGNSGVREGIVLKPWRKLAENYLFIIVITVLIIALSHWY
jgi:hypothetical protein